MSSYGPSFPFLRRLPLVASQGSDAKQPSGKRNHVKQCACLNNTLFLRKVFILSGTLVSKRAGMKYTHGYLLCYLYENDKRCGKTHSWADCKTDCRNSLALIRASTWQRRRPGCLLERTWKSEGLQPRQGGWDFLYRHHGDLGPCFFNIRLYHNFSPSLFCP